MGETTGISWASASFNPWIGCERVSPACAHCYADTLASGRMGMPGLWEAGGPRRITADSTWKKPLKWNRDAAAEGKRLRVFCASMADVFEEHPALEVPRVRLFALIDATPSLDWLLLTKRPEFARDWLREYYTNDDGFRSWVGRDGIGWGVLPNVWVGVSVENQRWTWRADVLREIPCPVRFISAEPLLGSLLAERAPSAERLGPDGGELRSARSLNRIVSSDSALGSAPARASYDAAEGGRGARDRAPLDLTHIDWLIVGGESGARKDARPMHPAWARELRDAAASTPLPNFEEHRLGIPFHFKQWGSWAPVVAGAYLGRKGQPYVVARGAPLFDFVDETTLGTEDDVVYYAGASPKSGGNLLDGVQHLDVPGETHPLFSTFEEAA